MPVSRASRRAKAGPGTVSQSSSDEEPGSGPGFGPKLSALAARDLTKLGVEQHMDSIVTEADLHGAKVKDHEGTVTRYEVGTILWTAGVQAPPLAAEVAKATGAKQDRAGRLCVNDDLTIPGHPDILVTGDMMSLDKLPGWRNRIGALFGWWFAFTRDLRRERGFTIDDTPVGVYSSQAESAASIPKTPAG